MSINKPDLIKAKDQFYFSLVMNNSSVVKTTTNVNINKLFAQYIHYTLCFKRIIILFGMLKNVGLTR